MKASRSWKGFLGLELLDRLGRKIVAEKAGNLIYLKGTGVTGEEENDCPLRSKITLVWDVTIGGSTIPGEYILLEVIGDIDYLSWNPVHFAHDNIGVEDITVRDA